MLTTPDFSAAISFALKELEEKLPAKYTYHSYRHTAHDVMPAAVRLARHTGLPNRGVQLLEVAAAYHDLGFLIRVDGHEAESARLAGEALPQFGFSPPHIAHIQRTIIATQLPQSPHDLAGQLLADADLDLLGREDFFELSDLLKEETERLNGPISESEWNHKQLTFLTGHQYFTAAARRLRNDQKAINVEKLKELIA